MSDTSTRSGMLWEVERILCECKELGTMPEILLMKNVPQVHGTKNVDDFNKWQLKLEELGYKNYFQDLIATDYGVPQTRNRCFMVSILGDYSYTFPKPIPLKLKLKDLLEDEVDEKYYLSDKMIKYISANNEKWTGNNNESLINKTYASTINTNEGSRRCDASNYICNNVGENYNLKIKNATKKGYLEATVGDGIDISSRMEHHRGTVQKEKSQTLTTSCEVGVVVGTYQYANSDKFLKGKNRFREGKEVSDTLQTQPKEGVVINNNPKVLGGIGKKKSNNNTQWYQQDRVYDDNVAISVTTAFNPYYKDNLRIRKLTPKECFRLMGVKDEDFEKVAKSQSDSSLYHLAGDSIIVNVLMAIFKEMM